MKERGTAGRPSMRFFAVVLVLVALIGCALRVWWVNERVYPYPYAEEHHAMGEWVELDGAFISDATEHTEGYAMRVTDAELFSYREYLDAYGVEGIEVPGDSELNVASILCLTIEMRNDSDSLNGALLLGEVKLVPVGMPLLYSYDPVLWGLSNPNIEQTSFLIGVVPGTSTVQHVPYGVGDLDPDGIGDRYYSALPTAESYELVVSNAPVRHVIDIEIG